MTTAERIAKATAKRIAANKERLAEAQQTANAGKYDLPTEEAVFRKWDESEVYV